MPPKPVRIGLTKRRREEDSDDESVVAPLSVSLMNALEDIVSVNVDPNEEDNFEESEDLFADDIDRDRDPDYVQPEAQPGPSRREKALTQPALNLVTTETAGKGRSSAPIWNFFNVSDKKVNGRIEKGAMCKVDVGGVPCGKRIMQRVVRQGVGVDGYRRVLDCQQRLGFATRVELLLLSFKGITLLVVERVMRMAKVKLGRDAPQCFRMTQK